MKVVDAFSGKVIPLGGEFVSPGGVLFKLHSVSKSFPFGLFGAEAIITRPGPEFENHGFVVPLVVRFAHPMFFGELVGFLPT